MKKSLIASILILFFTPVMAQKLGINKSFYARYNMIESQNIRFQKIKGGYTNSTVKYDKFNKCIIINSMENEQKILVNNFRKEYIGDIQMNCMNVIQTNLFGENEEVIGVVWWDENRFAFGALGSDKIIVFYNAN